MAFFTFFSCQRFLKKNLFVMILLFLFSLYFWVNALFHITSTFDPIESLSRSEHVWKTGQEFGSRNFHFPMHYLGKLWSWFFWKNLKCCLQGGWMGSALGSKNNVVKDTAVGVEVPLSPVQYIDMTYRLPIYRHFWKISISIWRSWKYRYRYRYR